MIDLAFPLDYAAFRNWSNQFPEIHAALTRGFAELAERIRKAGHEPARVLIYGGSVSGCVAYGYLKDLPWAVVIGVADRNHPDPFLRHLPHILPGAAACPAFDVLLLALSPAHFAGIGEDFVAALPRRPLVCAMFQETEQAPVSAGQSLASYAESLKRFHANSRPRLANIVMLGDSITCSFEWNELLGRTDVCNRGVNGDTLSGMLARLRSVIGLRPQVVCVMAGVNDLLQGASHEDVLHNYTHLVNSLREAGICVIVQSTLHVNPLFSAGLDMGAVNLEVTALNRGLSELCAWEGLAFLDLNARLSRSGELIPSLTHNGLHLSADGYLEWKEALLPLLDAVLPSPGGA